MPTASNQMIDKLAEDAKTVNAILVKLQSHVKKMGAPPSKAVIDKLQAQYDKIEPQITKFAREIGLKPPIFADEDDYKLRRKDITTLMTILPKAIKMAADEAKAGNDGVVEFEVFSAAKAEILVKDKKLAQAVGIMARGDNGRAGPKEKGIDQYNHIHIGGNAKWNLLFDVKTRVILGTIDFHIDKKNSDSEKEKVKAVAGRSGSKVTLYLKGDAISASK